VRSIPDPIDVPNPAFRVTTRNLLRNGLEFWYAKVLVVTRLADVAA
jgi:hypothetical protein